MPEEQSAGAVIFFQDKQKIEYLMLQYRHMRWDFPRGHVEPGETAKQTAVREIKEETGLSELHFIDNFYVTAPWQYTRPNEKTPRHKQATYFLARSLTKKVKLDFENLDFAWVDYGKALTLPSWPHVNKVLSQANKFLAEKHLK